MSKAPLHPPAEVDGGDEGVENALASLRLWLSMSRASTTTVTTAMALSHLHRARFGRKGDMGA